MSQKQPPPAYDPHMPTQLPAVDAGEEGGGGSIGGDVGGDGGVAGGDGMVPQQIFQPD